VFDENKSPLTTFGMEIYTMVVFSADGLRATHTHIPCSKERKLLHFILTAWLGG
jgi:hypothetical protein